MTTETGHFKKYFNIIKYGAKFASGLLFNLNPVITPVITDMCGDIAYKDEEEYGYTRENATRRNSLTPDENFNNGKAKPETPKWLSTKNIIAITTFAGASFAASQQSFTAGCLAGLALIATKAVNDSGALGLISKPTTSITPTGERVPHKTAKFSSGVLMASLKQSAIGIVTTGAGNLLHEPFMKIVKIGLDYLY